MTDATKYSSEKMDRYFNDPAFRRELLKSNGGFMRRHRRWFVLGSITVLALVAWCRVGPAGARVERIEVAEQALTFENGSFQVRP